MRVTILHDHYKSSFAGVLEREFNRKGRHCKWLWGCLEDTELLNIREGVAMVVGMSRGHGVAQPLLAT